VGRRNTRLRVVSNAGSRAARDGSKAGQDADLARLCLWLRLDHNQQPSVVEFNFR
jgi:hypothetical protein